jgi:hypothetical protein
VLLDIAKHREQKRLERARARKRRTVQFLGDSLGTAAAIGHDGVKASRTVSTGATIALARTAGTLSFKQVRPVDLLEEKLIKMCADHREKGITSERLKHRLVNLFGKWRREKAWRVKAGNMAEFNMACNEIDETLNWDTLIPNRIRKMEVCFRRARKYVNLL